MVKNLEAAIRPGVVVLYTDGFKARGYEGIGWAVSVWKDGAETEALSRKLGRAEAFNAEVVALVVALGVAAAEGEALVLSNSQVAVSAVSKGFSPSSQPAVRRAYTDLQHPGVKLEWCPAHAGVKGNGRAD